MNFMSYNIRGILGEGKASQVREIRFANKISALALQETKVSMISNLAAFNFWGNRNCEHAFSASEGLSGGLVWIWDPKVFKANTVIQKRYYLVVKGIIVGCGEPINLVNIYAPQNTSAKLALWDELSSVIDQAIGKWVLVGDFNAVRSQEERRNSKFKPACSENFNNFIFNNGLLEYLMQGRKFTCIRDNGKNLSKLDRFLVCPEFFNKWPSVCVRVLPPRHSDHCPIILETVELNFGPRPFRVYNSWIGKLGFEESVRKAVEGFQYFDPPDLCLSSKFACIRSAIKN
ncbi:uncharacterized protein LOC110882597 [Helianthus annuus]|uniref:uncharacterized protein LOC110882597 n=1 Tax=Helianthus annuus TaxID=4232 RepID=UPI000B8EFD9E|nr:uncharacterized protein LOC110882597 [Helianthus annuus]